MSEPCNMRISEDAKKLFAEKKIYPQYKKSAGKYKRNTVLVNTDYNLLENQYAVRKFFQAKHNLTLRELELLLYLFPKQFFSFQDYKAYPLSFSHRKISTVINKGFVKIFKKGKNQSKHVYTLSNSAKHLVIVYYKYLGGELQVPLNPENNPLNRKDMSPQQSKVMEFFKQMREKQKKEQL
jgi:hypothetical protein